MCTYLFFFFSFFSFSVFFSFFLRRMLCEIQINGFTSTIQLLNKTFPSFLTQLALMLESLLELSHTPEVTKFGIVGYQIFCDDNGVVCSQFNLDMLFSTASEVFFPPIPLYCCGCPFSHRFSFPEKQVSCTDQREKWIPFNTFNNSVN